MTEKKSEKRGSTVHVKASLVQVKGVDGKVFYLYAGDVTDADKVSPESLEHLKSLGFVEVD